MYYIRICIYYEQVKYIDVCVYIQIYSWSNSFNFTNVHRLKYKYTTIHRIIMNIKFYIHMHIVFIPYLYISDI